MKRSTIRTTVAVTAVGLLGLTGPLAVSAGAELKLTTDQIACMQGKGITRTDARLTQDQLAHIKAAAAECGITLPTETERAAAKAERKAAHDAQVAERKAARQAQIAAAKAARQAREAARKAARDAREAARKAAREARRHSHDTTTTTTTAPPA